MKKFNKNSAIRKINLQQNKNTYIKRLSISLSCLILLICIILFTFAKFNTSSDIYTLINGQIGEYPRNICNYEIGKTWTFNYNGTNGSNGSGQTFTAPCNGEYKLEVWGAQGGGGIKDSDNYTGGYGAYSVGEVNLPVQSSLKINVGGNGVCGNSTTTTNNIGGYNGGGDAPADAGHITCSGGGATHIATVSGLLKNLSSYKNTGGNNNSNEILIVAGGGGGASWARVGDIGTGGSGGGKIGSNGVTNALTSSYTTGGTQSESGCYYTNNTPYNESCNGSFGLGAKLYNYQGTYHGGAGGGGYYGGGATTYDYSAGGGGGSGYIGSSRLLSSNGITKHMTCYNCESSNNIDTKTVTNTCHNSNPTVDCSKEGNGYAKITLISTPDRIKIKLNANGGTLSENEIVRNQNRKIGDIPIPTRVAYNFKGWYSDQALTNQVDENTIVTTQLYNLYAKWEEKTLYTITNIMTNGSFENGVPIGSDNGTWGNFDSSYVAVSSSTQKHKHGSKSLRVDFIQSNQLWLVNPMTGISVPVNHKIYARVSGYVEQGNLSLGIVVRNEAEDLYWAPTYNEYNSNAYNQSQTWIQSPNQVWEDYAVYFNTQYNYFMILLSQAFNNNVGSILYYDNLLFIDLTDAFGAGNEPSKEWCDQNIDYFDGVSTIYKD